jgi:hypothetical protein
MKSSFFTSLPPVVKTSRWSGDSRLVRHIAKKFPSGLSIAREEVSRGFICEGKRAAIPETERSCPHDAEEVENIFCVIRSARGQATGRRPLGLGGWISLRLQLKTLRDNRRRCLLSADEREVVGGVVCEFEEFGDLKGG